MSKINRDELADALESPYETSDVILQAAQAFYDITAPDYAPSDEMLKDSIPKECIEEDAHLIKTMLTTDFRAMVKGLII